MTGERADVVVVGAGISGLCAGRKLMRQGVDVTIVEARDRVGGRTWTQDIGRARFDVGGQWIGPGQDRVNALVAELGLETFRTFTKGKKVLELGGKISTYKSAIPSLSMVSLIQMQGAISYLERVRKRIPPSAPMSAPNAMELDGETLETWLHRFVKSSKISGVLDAAVRTVFGTEARDVSALYFLMYLNAGGGLKRVTEADGGAQQDRFVLGAQSISQALAKGLGDAVMLGAPVRTIRQSTEGLEVVSDAGVVSGRYAIVAVPPTLAGRIDYEPGVSVARDQLTQRFAMGATVKVVVTYKRTFWRDAGFSGEVVSADGPLSVVYDNSSHDGKQAALVGFIVGKHARSWSSQPAADRERRVLAALAKYFGDDARLCEEYHELDWGTEPWSRGCPVGGLPPGVLSDSFANLRKPEGRIHWAGTESATEWMGYMEGAIQSGERAADEVIRRL
ncbi:MAG: flavin monoamine oxidase family protein [Polyangiales bacterium]